MARETKSEATEMMKTYLGEEEEALDGFEFLAMAEAGELSHWEIVEKIASDRSATPEVTDARASWAVPVERGHLDDRARRVPGAGGRRGQGDGDGRGTRIAGEGEPEGVALAAAVALEHLAERALQLGHERGAVLGREPDVAGDPE